MTEFDEWTDPFARAARRTGEVVRPQSGRREGRLTESAESFLPDLLWHLATLPQRAIESTERRRLGGDYDPGPVLEAATAALPLSAARNVMRSMPPARSGMESKSANLYNPPAKPPRPFTDDYPAGAPADAAGRLTHTIDGDPVTARYVVGRRVVGRDDEAFPSAQLNALAEATTGRGFVGRASRDIRGDAGRLVLDRRSGRPAAISYDRALKAEQAERVVAHELGHAIGVLAGRIPTKGLSNELRAVYNDLNNPSRGGKPFTPQAHGYRGSDVQREYMAEAVRAYMADPNYIKTVAPRTARAIRKGTYSSPHLRDVIQFNAFVPFSVLAGWGSYDPDDR